MEEDDMVKSMAIASYGDALLREEEMPRPSLGYPKSPRACTRIRDKRSLTRRAVQYIVCFSTGYITLGTH